MREKQVGIKKKKKKEEAVQLQPYVCCLEKCLKAKGLTGDSQQGTWILGAV